MAKIAWLCAVAVATAGMALGAGQARADEAVATELPPPKVSRVDNIEKEMAELKALVRYQGQELARMRSEAQAAPITRSAVQSPPPPAVPANDCWQQQFRAPCPPPAIDPCRNPCICPEDLGQADPSIVAGYDKKFYVRTRDGRFKATLGVYTQFRFTYHRREVEHDDFSQDNTFWEMVRTRIFLEAEFTRYLYTHFRFNVNSEGDAELINGYLRIKPCKDMNIQIGRQFLAVSREDWMFPMDLQTMDFSANDAVFAIGTAEGIQLYKQFSRDRFWVALSDGAFGGGQGFDAMEAEWMVSGRYEHQLLTTDWGIWDDLVGRRGRPMGILLGVAGGYQEGGANPETKNGYVVTADVSVNWDGGQLLAYGSWRHGEIYGFGEVDDYGWLVQAGHFIDGNFQLYARYEMVIPDKDRPGYQEDYESALAGINYYPCQWTNKYKFSAEVGYLFSPLDDTIVPSGSSIGFLEAEDGDQWYFRIQAQFGF